MTSNVMGFQSDGHCRHVNNAAVIPVVHTDIVFVVLMMRGACRFGEHDVGLTCCECLGSSHGGWRHDVLYVTYTMG